MNRKAGFTLVELALVLAILGLIVGGVIAGQALIRSAQIKNVMTDKEQIVSAFNNFSTQYKGLPGDMINATRYWGTDPDGCITHSNRVMKTETCNGDGDNRIEAREDLRGWQHLANAGIYGTMMTGVTGSAGAFHHVAGENVPPGPIPNTAWSIGWLGDDVGYFSGSGTFLQGYYKHRLVLGAMSSSGGSHMPAFTPEELYLIDNKHDDGLPHTGSIMAGSYGGCTDATTQSDLPAVYELSNSGEECSIVFTKILE